MKTFTIKTLINQYANLIEKFLGWDKKILKQKCDDYLFDKDDGLNNFMWSLFNKMLLIKNDDLEQFYSKQVSVYSAMALFLAHYESKDGKKLNRLMYKEVLAKAHFEAVSSPRLFWELEIIGDLRCPIGKEYDGRRYPLDGTVNALPLAGKDCWRDYCSCTTARVAKRDISGKLIWNN